MNGRECVSILFLKVFVGFNGSSVYCNLSGYVWMLVAIVVLLLSFNEKS